MTVFFVDGPDGTGKTGYSKHLAREIGFRRLEMRPVESTEAIEAKSAVFNAVVRDLDAQNVDLVIDRGSVSSIVYSRVFGRDTPEHAWKTLIDVNPTVFYLSCDPDELAIRYGNNDEIFNAEGIREIALVYEDVMAELRGEVSLPNDYPYDPKDWKPLDIVEVDTTVKIASFLSEAALDRIHDDVETEA